MYDYDVYYNSRIMENKDFVLLPDKVIRMLVLEYGGGPHYGRKVQNKGCFESPISNFVDLFPIRFELFSCSKGKRNKLYCPGKSKFIICVCRCSGNKYF